MENKISIRWRKSSYSGNGGSDCVEVADHGNRVLVRDSKDTTGPVLRFSPATWRTFADWVKHSLRGTAKGHPHVLRVPFRCVRCRFPRGRHGAVCALRHAQCGSPASSAAMRGGFACAFHGHPYVNTTIFCTFLVHSCGQFLRQCLYGHCAASVPG